MALVKIDELTAGQVASITDHTFLKQEDAFTKDPRGAVVARTAALDEFLEKTVPLNPYAVCVRHYDVLRARRVLDDLNKKNVKIAAVIGFPNGDTYCNEFYISNAATTEIEIADANGADEIDFVLPTKGQFNSGGCVECYICDVNEKIKDKDMSSKLILEVSELTPEQIKWACGVAEKAGVDFVKTSTGYSKSGATVEALKIMRDNFTRGVKISGGVTPENYKDLLAAASGREDGMIDLHHSFVRIGASSLLPALYAGKKSEGSY